jgi:uncharacterized protein YcbX
MAGRADRRGDHAGLVDLESPARSPASLSVPSRRDAVKNVAMQLAAIWRHPVKSLQGEPLTTATIDDDGMRGDRKWGIRDEATGMILTGRREPRLLLAAATLTDDGDPQVTLPGGVTTRGVGPSTDRLLSDWLERPVTLVQATDAPGGQAEFFADATDDSSQAIEWTMPSGRFVDAMPLLVVTSASLRAGQALHPAGNWDVRRFRPNLFVEVDGDDWIEDGWCGRTLRIGAVEVVPSQGCVRCTMVTRPQPGLERDLDVYKTIARHHGGTFGVWSGVLTPGTVHVGEPVVIADA